MRACDMGPGTLLSIPSLCPHVWSPGPVHKDLGSVLTGPQVLCDPEYAGLSWEPGPVWAAVATGGLCLPPPRGSGLRGLLEQTLRRPHLNKHVAHGERGLGPKAVSVSARPGKDPVKTRAKSALGMPSVELPAVASVFEEPEGTTPELAA